MAAAAQALANRAAATDAPADSGVRPAPPADDRPSSPAPRGGLTGSGPERSTDRPSWTTSMTDRSAPNQTGSDRQVSDRLGTDRQDFDRQGSDRQDFDRQGSDRQDFDRQGSDRQDFDRQGSDRLNSERLDADEPGSERPAFAGPVGAAGAKVDGGDAAERSTPERPAWDRSDAGRVTERSSWDRSGAHEAAVDKAALDEAAVDEAAADEVAESAAAASEAGSRGSATDAFGQWGRARGAQRAGEAHGAGLERRTAERRYGAGEWHEQVSASYPISLGRSSRTVPPRPAPMVPVVPVMAERSEGAAEQGYGGWEPVAQEPDPGWNAVSGTFALPESTGAGEEDFEPANATEAELYDAAQQGSTDVYLSTLLLATVLVPMTSEGVGGAGVPRTEVIDGQRYLVVFTSQQRLGEHIEEPVRTRGVRFVDLIQNWPDPEWSFAVNPGGPVGATLPSAQLVALANWAAEAGLGATEQPQPAPEPEVIAPVAASAAVPVMQKIVPTEHVDYLLDRGYDRVSGFVYRAHELAHLRTPAELAAALGLGPDVKELHVLRWPAHRPNLYRIPYGGPTESAMRAMDGWVVERAPFRGNGFAPGESADVVAEFKVDSVRLPHGAQLWHLDAGGAERLVALFDADAAAWRRVGED
jgi:hypothetical protein